MDRITEYITQTKFEHPTLVIDSTIVEDNYSMFRKCIPRANIYYAVKANPHSSILKRLNSVGSCFDAASIKEIRDCIRDGIHPCKISFGNTIKPIKDIYEAYKLGVDTFMADSFQELDKIAQAAPGSRVFIRLLVNNDTAQWPLGKKFGCSEEFVVPLVQYAKSLNLRPIGLSFHIGSQNTEVDKLCNAIRQIYYLYETINDTIKVNLTHLNIGGGFPVEYGNGNRYVDLGQYLRETKYALNYYFPDTIIWCEPGRALAATAGKIVCEVVLVSSKKLHDTKWVYLDIGRFHGLAETENEAIQYEFSVIGKQKNDGFYNLAGPTCDSADILYEQNKVKLPKDITYGDKVIIHNVGVYTSTYSSVGFNGFPPLEVVSI
jgi:ornithine decarboxylase